MRARCHHPPADRARPMDPMALSVDSVIVPLPGGHRITLHEEVPQGEMVEGVVPEQVMVEFEVPQPKVRGE